MKSRAHVQLRGAATAYEANIYVALVIALSTGQNSIRQVLLFTHEEKKEKLSTLRKAPQLGGARQSQDSNLGVQLQSFPLSFTTSPA